MMDDIDFAELYRQQFRLSGRRPKTPQDWDARANAMSRTCAGPASAYVQDFVSRMDLRDADTLLDVGCGTGAICLAIAPQFGQVYAVDFSPGMLEVLAASAKALQLQHVQCIERAWEDNWDDIPACDIVVASRAMMVADMDQSLRKLTSKAKKRVYTTHLAADHCVTDDVLRLIDCKRSSSSDYMYAVNLLHQQGLRASVDFIVPPLSYAGTEQLKEEDFIEAVRWSAGELSPQNMKKLQDYYREKAPIGQIGLRKDKAWAFVSWETC